MRTKARVAQHKNNRSRPDMWRLPARFTANSTLLSVVLAAGAAQGATPPKPDIGDALRQARPPAVPVKPTPALPPIRGTEPEPPLEALPGGPTVEVRRFELVGNRVIATERLLPLISDVAGKSLTLAALEELALRITRYYRAAGYFVARAYIPAQEITGGTVTIRVVEGNYGKFVVRNDSRVRDDIIQGVLDDVRDRDVVSLDTLERAMLIIDDTPGARVMRADVMPGEKVGTSDFAIATAPTPAFGGYVALDNYGSVYTGRNRLSFNADWNSPTARGDRLSVSGMSSDTRDLLNGRLAYSALLRPNGLRGEIAASETTYNLGDRYAALDAVGKARAVEASLSYPVKRTTSHSVEASLGLAHKDLTDEVRTLGTRVAKTLQSATVRLASRSEDTVWGSSGLTRAEVAITVGHLHLRDDVARAQDAVGAKTEGRYSKVAASLSRVSLLPYDFSLTTLLSGQKALGKNLDGSERMSVAGPGAVMAYPTGELIGDNVVLARVELAHPLPAVPAVAGMQWTVSTFADYGWARAERPLTGQSSRELGDAGVGVSANWRNGAFMRVQFARRLSGEATSESTSSTRVLLQAGWVL